MDDDKFVIIKPIEETIQETYVSIADQLLNQRNALLNISKNEKYIKAKTLTKLTDSLDALYSSLNSAYESTLFNLKKKNIDVYNKIGGWILPDGPQYVPEKHDPVNRVKYLTKLSNISNEITQQYLFMQVSEFNFLKSIITNSRTKFTPENYLAKIQNNSSIILSKLSEIDAMINDDVFKKSSKGGKRTRRIRNRRRRTHIKRRL